jgi:hypothetical protein
MLTRINSKLSCQNRIFSKNPSNCGYDPHIWRISLWGGSFQMAVAGERQFTGGKGRNHSGQKG